MLDYVIRSGQVVTPWGVGDWDVAIQGEKIVAVAAPGTLTGDIGRVIDASGQVVIPGGIEPHAHIAAPIMGFPDMETAPPEQVTRAALFGGTTTLVDFAIQRPGNDIFQTLEEEGLRRLLVSHYAAPRHLHRDRGASQNGHCGRLPQL